MQTTSKKILFGTMKVLSAAFLAMFTIMAIAGTFDVASATIATGFAFSSIDWEGGDNIGGFTSEAFLGLYHEIDTFPTLSENPSKRPGAGDP